MLTMIVLANLKEGVRPGDYERWISETHAPVTKGLPSVKDWRDYGVSGRLDSDATLPIRRDRRARRPGAAGAGHMARKRCERYSAISTVSPRSPSLCQTALPKQRAILLG